MEKGIGGDLFSFSFHLILHARTVINRVAIEMSWSFSNGHAIGCEGLAKTAAPAAFIPACRWLEVSR